MRAKTPDKQEWYDRLMQMDGETGAAIRQFIEDTLDMFDDPLRVVIEVRVEAMTAFSATAAFLEVGPFVIRSHRETD